MSNLLLITFPPGWTSEETQQQYQRVLREFNERFDEILDPLETLQAGEPIRLPNLEPGAFDWLQLKVADFTIRGFVYAECFCPGPCSCSSTFRKLWSTVHVVPPAINGDSAVQHSFTQAEIAWGCALAAMGKFTPTSLQRPTSQTWPLAEKLGFTRLQPGGDLFRRMRATRLYALVSGMSDEERAPYLTLVQQQEPHGNSAP